MSVGNDEKNNQDGAMSFEEAKMNVLQEVKEIFQEFFPESPSDAFGDQFFKEHGSDEGAAQRSVKFQEMSRRITTKVKARGEMLKEQFQQTSRENDVFVESCIRPLLAKAHIKSECQQGAQNILSFARRAHFVFLPIAVKKAVVTILDWATGEFKDGATERVVQYVLLGLDILLNDGKFKKLTPRVQIVALDLQYKDLYLLQARRILFKVWERSFFNLTEDEQIAELKEAVCEAVHEKECYKRMDISSEYILDMICKCEYLSERGEDVVRHIYDLLSSNLSLWHKYHIAKAISSPALAQLQANDAHYSQLLDAMKHSIDIAISSAKMGAGGAKPEVLNSADDGSGLDGDALGFADDDHLDDDDDEFLDEGHEELIDEYVNDLVLSESPPDYIEILDERNRDLLAQIIRDMFNAGVKRDIVDSFLNVIAHEIFMNLTSRSKRRLLSVVKKVLSEQKTPERSYEKALYNLVYFASHPKLARLAQRDVEWLVESVERLKVNFYDNSEASSLIEFLECFDKVAEGAELTTMCFYLGRLAPPSAASNSMWAEEKEVAI